MYRKYKKMRQKNCILLRKEKDSKNTQSKHNFKSKITNGKQRFKKKQIKKRTKYKKKN